MDKDVDDEESKKNPSHLDLQTVNKSSLRPPSRSSVNLIMAFNDLRRANARATADLDEAEANPDEEAKPTSRRDKTYQMLKYGDQARERYKSLMFKNRLHEELDYDSMMKLRAKLGYHEE